MAGEANASLEADLRRALSCSVCLELFREPVTLACGHSFCQGCITHVWRSRERQQRLASAPVRTVAAAAAGSGGGPDISPIPAPEVRSSYKCPECRQVCPNKRFTKNFLAANLVEKLQGVRVTSSSQGDPAPRKCEKHQNALTLFCAADQRLPCNLCRPSKAHRNCDVSLVQELTEEFSARKVELKSTIQEEFVRLLEFLIEEREALLLQLDQVHQAALQEMEKSQLQLGATVLQLEHSIADIKSKLNRPVPLKELLDVISRPIPDLGKHIVMNPHPRWDLLTGPHQLIAWKRMLDIINPGPANLYFDPKSAHVSLRFNRDYTLVEWSRSATPDLEAAPGDPGRFDLFPAVLASARFSSGRRYWEVDVTDSVSWHLGVTCVHSPRQGCVKLTPAHGYWSICRLLDYWENGEQRRPLSVDTELAKVGVYLDFEAGQLSFYDANCMALLCSFDVTFRSPVVPFFSPCMGVDSTLRLCHY